MPPISDPAAIRTILRSDPVWCIYALGDLAPPFFERTVWFSSDDTPPALVMLYCGFDPPVLFAVGKAEQVRPLLAEIGHPGGLSVHVRGDVLGLLGERYEIDKTDLMWRMRLPSGSFRPTATEHTVRLARADVPALERLYADGAAAGESPHFFLPSMVEEGVFFGIYEEGELIAAAGTHLVVQAEGVAAVGNIYSRRDRRSRGLAARTTSAVVNELLRRSLATVALNVNPRNVPAIRVYERLGFVRYCAYHEGLAPRQWLAAREKPSEGGITS
ncbi:MAG TPA: GNAT family N-acetyltransferase [Gemmataceae bacterium]|nr:GNAT family N-acetyltransferase [Gemmataceae bacterium]